MSLRKEYEKEKQKETLAMGRISSVLVILIVLYFIFQDIYLIKIPALAYWRGIPFLFFLAFLLSSLTWLKKNEQFVIPFYSTALLSIMIMLIGMTLTTINRDDECYRELLGLTGAVTVDIVGIYIISFRTKKYIPYITAIPTVAILIILLLKSPLAGKDLAILSNPLMIIFLVTIMSLHYEKRMFRLFISSRFLEQSNTKLKREIELRKEMGREASRQREKSMRLLSCLKSTSGNFEMDELMERIRESIRTVIRADGMGIYELDENRELELKEHYGLPPSLIGKITNLRKGEGISGQAVESGQIIIVTADEYPDNRMRQPLLELGFSCFASIPIIGRKNTLGAINLGFKEENNYDFLDYEFFESIGRQLGLVLENSVYFDRIKKLAHKDTLTGLNNRYSMMQILEEEQERYFRYSMPFCLGIGDLDNFKKINDTYGHNGGDHILKGTADCLKGICRNTDVIGRWGGEEFIFLFLDTDRERVGNSGKRIIREIEQNRVNCEGRKMCVTLSLGISQYKRGESLNACLSRADKALYQAKKDGKNRCVIH